ncbi:MAG: hypothetical protein HKO05_03470 [Erythrobacter sp.]|jgi:hypothetical protein|nr:hypothetical protein [Erythrobacter sp.]RZV35346.1 MAG: hypothetical protein EX262_02340 [Sphingomonadaceae bacterium]
MSRIDQQLHEDRLLRNAARALVDADIARVKADLDSGSLGRRAVARIKDGAEELLETASDAAESKPGVLAALIGAVVLWFARNPIFEALRDPDYDAESEEHQTPNPKSEI